ncbi:MAG: DUF488 domain-containing protein, partial [Thermoguttaceae bacterium]
ARVQRVLDVRLFNTSQLAGYTRQPDLAFFLREIAGIEYRHLQDFAPTKEMLQAYKKGSMDWVSYERLYSNLLSKRQVEKSISIELLAGACLLCSEPTAHKCHRRLAAEYLLSKFGGFRIVHL